MSEEKCPIVPRLLNVKQTAAYLNLAPQTIYNSIAPSSRRFQRHPFPIKPKKIGGKVLFDRRELDVYIEQL